MPDEGVPGNQLLDHLLHRAGELLDHLVSACEPVVVVEGLELIEVGIEQRELVPRRDPLLDLLLDPDVPRQTGERRFVLHLLRAAEDAAHPCEELRRIERLDDVVVRADREPLELVRGESTGG
jgi:hypothetical protein